MTPDLTAHGARPRWPAVARLRHLLALEVRLQWRYRVVAVVGLLALCWSSVLLVLPQAVARSVAPWVLVLETAVAGTTVAGALMIMERERGMRAAFTVTPARPVERLAARVGFVSGVVLGGAVPVALAGRPAGVGGLVAVLTGVGLTALLTTLVAVAVAAGRESVLTFMIMLPLVLLPLVAPALVRAGGVADPLLRAVPTAWAMDVVRAGYGMPAGAPGWSGWWSAGGFLLACVVAGRVARYRIRGEAGATRVPRPPAGPPPAEPSHPAAPIPVARSGARRRRPVRSLLRTDLATARHDPLLALIGASPLLLALALRFGYPPVRSWLAMTSGFDLAPYRPLLLAVAVTLHLPVVFGIIGALLVLDEADSGALAALRVSPLSVPGYLCYRAALVAAATAVGLAVALPLSGLAPPGGAAALAPAAAVAVLMAPLVTAGTLALAANKVEGVGVAKLLGAPLYLPVAGWWVSGPAGWLFSPLPTWWLLEAQWAAPAASAAGYAAGGVAVTAAVLVLVGRRAVARWRAPTS